MELVKMKKELVEYLNKFYVPYLGNISKKSFGSYLGKRNNIMEESSENVYSVAQLIEYYRPINPSTGKKINDTEIKKYTGVDVYSLKNKVPMFGIYNKETISKIVLLFGMTLSNAKKLFSAARILLSPENDIFDSVLQFYIKDGKYYSSNLKENIDGFVYCLNEGTKYIESLGAR